MTFKKLEKPNEKNFILNDFSGGMENSAGKNPAIKYCENFIYESGKLVSRKGLNPKPDSSLLGDSASEIVLDNVWVFHGGKKMQLIALLETDEMNYIGYNFYLLGPDGEVVRAAILSFTRVTSDEFNMPETLYAFAGKPINGSGIFAIAAVKMQLTGKIETRFFELNKEFTEWNRIWETDMYIPTIYRNGRGNMYKQSVITLPEPEFPEGRNLLSPYANYFFTSDGSSDCFYLPIQDPLKESGDFVMCELTLNDGTVLTFSIRYGYNYSNKIQYNNKEVYMQINNTLGLIYFVNIVPPVSQARKNNVKVTVYCKSSSKSEVISKMTKCIWYSSGNSGSRLCLAGNKDNPSLVCVSAADNPFYFPEDAAINAGDPNQKVTALAVQNKSLVIFKQKELYCGSFTSGKLNLTHLHSAIGCDNPNTVKLCENRLVWANKDKKIYTLNSVNDYGAVAVYIMSKKAEHFLKDENFNNISAAYLNNKYYLFFGNKIYVCDMALSVLQNSREFINSAAFYKLTLPTAVKVMAGFGENEIKLLCKTTLNGYIYSVYDFSAPAGTDIVKTGTANVNIGYKNILEFDGLDNGEPHIKKQFSRVYISCYSQKGADVEIKDIYGDTVKKSHINMKYTCIKNAVPYRLEPFINTESIGIRLSTEGEAFVHSVTAYYKELI